MISLRQNLETFIDSQIDLVEGLKPHGHLHWSDYLTDLQALLERFENDYLPSILFATMAFIHDSSARRVIYNKDQKNNAAAFKRYFPDWTVYVLDLEELTVSKVD